MPRQHLQTITEAKLQQFIEGIHIYNTQQYMDTTTLDFCTYRIS